MPLPIQENSRRLHIQRFLNSNQLSVVLLWFPIIELILARLFKPLSQLVICKTGGYNLEGSLASPDGLVRIILLIALAMTSAWLQGQKTQSERKQSYVCRMSENKRTRKRQ
ncbi:hypothetical protein H6F32_08345 [Anabaena sp. FACHB-1237]|uniref:hypothetical protein n=1 Tax=Anabaena sp. FACHB-1237 TaxID=2692769 RepID=UPI0016816C3B|nr:hypothetical protein [Anabaena sp. FACHB-1237]MBD2137593.1 hypothetical protein [Anabaena sp. FACHB-1237]